MVPVSQKFVNRTISNLSYDHLPTKFATVSQNLSEYFFTISDYDLWLWSLLCAEVRKSINLPGPRTCQINLFILHWFYLSSQIALTGQLFVIYGNWPKYSFSGACLIPVEQQTETVTV